jgi:hypothetical protein
VLLVRLGVIVCWGLDELTEKDLVKMIGSSCKIDLYHPEEVGGD